MKHPCYPCWVWSGVGAASAVSAEVALRRRQKRQSHNPCYPARPLQRHHADKVKMSTGQSCQHRKVKCDIDEGQDRCTRCTRLNLTCVINKSLQTLLDGENEWKREMEAKVESLQAALAQVQGILKISESGNGHHQPHYARQSSSAGTPQAVTTPLGTASRPSFSGSMHSGDVKPTIASMTTTSQHLGGPSPSRPQTTTAMTRENSVDVDSNGRDEAAIAAAPMASLFEVTKLRNIRSDPGAHIHGPSSRQSEPDFISQGRVSLQDAEQLFASFRGTLNAYLWGGIALVHDSLDSTRRSSTLLTSAILAVTALHQQDEGRMYDICYPIFLELVSQTMFDRYHTLDDVRALCIGAFWLSDVSWKLSGLAVRIATELNLHQACAKALHNGTSHAEEARLWYFLYVCDHHFSIAYGRPPVINENPTITCHEHFLQRPDVTQADFRLHSQVGIFIILSRVFHTFGPDRARMIGSDEFETLRRFDADMGYWRDRWKTRLGMSPLPPSQ